MPDQVQLSDVFKLCIKRRYLFLVVFIGALFLPIHPKPYYHFKKSYILVNYTENSDYQSILQLRNYFLRDFLLLAELLKSIPDPPSIDTLQYHILAVKISSYPPGFVFENGKLSDSRKMDFYVKYPDKEAGMDILNLWTELCLKKLDELKFYQAKKLKDPSVRAATQKNIWFTELDPTLTLQPLTPIEPILTPSDFLHQSVVISSSFAFFCALLAILLAEIGIKNFRAR